MTFSPNHSLLNPQSATDIKERILKVDKDLSKVKEQLEKLMNILKD